MTFREKFFVSQYQKISLGNTSVYRKILGSEKIYASERGEGVSKFSIEIFLSHSAENFRRGESFSVSLISCVEKFYASEGYVTIFEFLSKIICLITPKNFVGEPFRVSLISGTEIVWIRGGGYQDFPSKTICVTVPKFSVGESFTVALISGIEKVWMRWGGGIKIFHRKLFVSQCRNFP